MSGWFKFTVIPGEGGRLPSSACGGVTRDNSMIISNLIPKDNVNLRNWIEEIVPMKRKTGTVSYSARRLAV